MCIIPIIGNSYFLLLCTVDNAHFRTFIKALISYLFTAIHYHKSRISNSYLFFSKFAIFRNATNLDLDNRCYIRTKI